jgi:ribosomal protein S8
MARLRVLDDTQLKEDLRKKFEMCQQVMNKVQIEFDLCNEIYQGVQSNWREGALDTALLTQLFIKRPSDDDIRLDSTALIHATMFLHSKLSISDPQIVMKPLNSDIKNYKAAQNAQVIVEHIKEVTQMSEELQKGPYLDTAIKGNGVVFVGWNPDGGELEADSIPKDFNPLEDEITMTGEYELRSVRPECFFIDPSATILEKNADYVFEIEFKQFNALAACSDIPEEIIEIVKEEMNSEESLNLIRKHINNKVTAETNTLVPLYHYWEPHRVWNGMVGTHIVFVCAKEPKLVLRENNKYSHGRIPYAMLTDIDIPNSTYGMSRLLFALPMMEALSQMFTQVIANIELHGNIRMMLPEGGLNDEARTNNPYDILFYNPATGNEPKQITPTHITTDIWRFEEIARQEISKIYGMGEFSQGQIPRELSSYAVQIAIEMDDKFRIRLFNKKKEFIKNIYEMSLSNTKQYVKTKRMLKIVGNAKISDNVFFESADLEGDYGISSDYGMYLPIDPAARKQQILELVKSNILQDAGIDMKKIISVLVSGDVLEVKDLAEKSKQIQDKENLELVVKTIVPVQPWHEHEGHIESMSEFMQSMEFENLTLDVKQFMYQHKQEHIEALAKLKAEAQGGMGEENPPPEGGGVQPSLGTPPKREPTGIENLTQAPAI